MSQCNITNNMESDYLKNEFFMEKLIKDRTVIKYASPTQIDLIRISTGMFNDDCIPNKKQLNNIKLVLKRDLTKEELRILSKFRPELYEPEFKYIKDPSLNVLKEIMKFDKKFINLLDSKSVYDYSFKCKMLKLYASDVCPSILFKLITLTLVKSYPWLICFIKGPDTNLQLASVSKDGLCIQYIYNPSEEVQLAAVQNTAWAIEYIKNPTEKVQLVAVKSNGWTIQFINNTSTKVQLAAIDQEKDCIIYIDNPSNKTREHLVYLRKMLLNQHDYKYNSKKRTTQTTTKKRVR